MAGDVYPSFADERWVRAMADYGGGGVWHRDGCGDDPDDLPLSRELVAHIQHRQDWFEESDPYSDDDGFDGIACSAEGHAIAQAVKSVLPDWTVIYDREEIHVS
jgi:hypothetical protein